MATLAVAAAGAALGAAAGAAIGGTVLGVSAVLFGAQLGFVLGSLAGNLLFAPEPPDQKGPRLNDVNVSTSTYGRVIPIPYGSCTVGANMIWLGQIIERKNEREVGGKGLGGGGATQTTFEYFGNFAAALCEGPIQAIRRIWADNRLVIDLSPNNDGQSYKYDAGNYTIYLGTEDQQPDSLIEADLGAGNVPAYRGTAYIVFNELPLKDFGNRIPNIEAEIVSVANPEWSSTTGIGALSGLNFTKAGLLMDRQDPILWACNGAGRFQKIERFGNNLIQQKDFVDIVPVREEFQFDGSGVYLTTNNDGELEVRFDGSLDGVEFDDWVNGNTVPIVDSFFDLIYLWGRSDADATDTWLLEFDKDFNFTGFGWKTGKQKILDNAVGHVVYNEANLKRLIVVAFQAPATTTGASGTGDACYIFNAGLNLNGPDHDVEASVGPFISLIDPEGEYGFNYGIALISAPMGLLAPGGTASRVVFNVCFDTDGEKIWVLTSQEDNNKSGPTIAEFDTATETWSFIALDGNPNAFSGYSFVLDIMDVETSAGDRAGITYDTRTGHIILIGRNLKSDTDYFRLDPNGWTVEASADRFTGDRPEGDRSKGESNSYPQVPGSFWVTAQAASGSSVNATVLIETTAFEVLEKRVHTSQVTDGSSAFDRQYLAVVDRRTTSLWGWESGGFVTRARFFDDDAGTSVADIIRDVATRINQTASDIDVSEVTGDTVAGYVISSESTARGAVEPLKLVAAMDAVESDWVIKFQKIDRSSVATVAWDDLGAEVGSESADLRLLEPRTQEKDLPIEVSVTGMLQSREYLPSTQTARRWQAQNAADSEGKNAIQIPVIFNSDIEIKRIADRVLFAQWSRRQNQEFQTGAKFLDIDPMDVVTIEKRGSGVAADIPSQITQMEIAPGGAISFTGRTAEPFLFTEAAVEPSVSVPTDELSGVGILVDSPTLGFFWDAPPITSINTSGSPVWAAAPLLGQSNYNWFGASLKRSSDGAIGSYQNVANTDVELPAFKLLESFPAADVIEDSWNAFNPDLSIQVEMVAGDTDPTSAPRLDVLNGANIAVIGTEVIQFIDVVNNGDGVFTLSNILRGRFGTETEMVERLKGTKGFLVSDAPDAFVAFGSEASRGQTNFYKSVTFGLFEDNVPATTFSHAARGLKPLSPTSLASTVDGSGNKTITWIRRTRFNGDWLDNTGRVPLNEAFLEYEVDIFRAKKIVRKFESITSESILYDKTSYDADFPANDEFSNADMPVFENFGFEKGNLSGWSDPSDDYKIAAGSGTLSSFEGVYLVENDTGSSSSFSDLTIEIDATELSVAGNAAVETRAHVGGTTAFATLNYRLKIECLDKNGNLLSEIESATNTASSGAWADVGSGSVNAPEDTTKLRITLRSYRRVAFDNVRVGVTRSSTGKVAAEVYQISDTVGRGQPRKRVV